MLSRTIVSVPATSANLGPGFDTMGLALNIRNRVMLEVIPEGFEFTFDGFGSRSLPRDRSNLIIESAWRLFDEVGEHPTGLHLHQLADIPVKKGLGSSSAAIVAGLFGANQLLGAPKTIDELVQMATAIEGHPDNVVPALLGGLTVSVMGVNRSVLTKRIEPHDWKMLMVVPDYTFGTDEARALLPTTVPMRDVVFNMSRSAMLPTILERGDHENLAEVMRDKLHQDYRLPQFPGSQEGYRAAMEAGASGVALSGAGPSLIVFAKSDKIDAIGQAVVSPYEVIGIHCQLIKTSISMEGVRVEDQFE